MKPSRTLVLSLTPWLLLAVFVASVFVYKLDDVGVWDPIELERAEAARTHQTTTIGWLGQQSIALGFRLFGTTAFGGRLPLAIWGLLGVGALFALVATFRSTRVALWSAAALSTMPLYFVQARAMLGDIVMLASGSIAFAGLAIATFATISTRLRFIAWFLGLLGVACGVLTRGALFGAAVPALAVGVVWMLTPHRDRLSRLSGAFALAIGLGGLVVFVAMRNNSQYNLLVGVRATTGDHPSFDTTIASVIHSVFPWSALLPFAFSRVISARDHHTEVLGPLLCIVAFFAYGAHVLAGAPTIAFCAPYALAGVLALALGELEDRPSTWAFLAISTACFSFLITRDYVRLSEKVFAPYALANAPLPESFRSTSDKVVWLSAGIVIGGAIAAGLATQLPFAIAFAKKYGSTIVLSCAIVAGLVLRMGYYPQLGAHLSPKGAFDSYNKLSRKGEPLALLSVDPRSSRYMHAGETLQMRGPSDAFTWLSGARERSRLLLRGTDLPMLNALQRENTGQNLTILDGRSSEMLLASNQLRDREHNDNPLDQIVLAEAPFLPHRLDAKFGEALEPLGWLTVDTSGRTTEGIRSGRTYRLRIYYRVAQKLEGSYCTFIHIENTPTRFSVEHKEAEWARYPMRWWRKGDVIADEFNVSLPAHFRAGKYPLYLGLDQLPCVGDKRVTVTRGAHSDQRLDAGFLEVLP